MGMVFAIRGLLGIRAHFGQVPLRHLFVDWLKRFPKWKKSVVIEGVSANLVLTGMKGRVEVWNPDNPTPTRSAIPLYHDDWLTGMMLGLSLSLMMLTTDWSTPNLHQDHISN
jgi:hypothetical protein